MEEFAIIRLELLWATDFVVNFLTGDYKVYSSDSFSFSSIYQTNYSKSFELMP
jgi:hypothetical protein